MTLWLKRFSIVIVLFVAASAAVAQERVTVLSGAELTRVVPTGFYFHGLSAQTQMRTRPPLDSERIGM